MRVPKPKKRINYFLIFVLFELACGFGIYKLISMLASYDSDIPEPTDTGGIAIGSGGGFMVTNQPPMVVPTEEIINTTPEFIATNSDYMAMQDLMNITIGWYTRNGISSACQSYSAAGCYNHETHGLSVYYETDNEQDTLYTTFHEIGHYLYFDVMSPEERDSYIAQIDYSCHEPITDYAFIGGVEEDFAENFATYYSNGTGRYGKLITNETKETLENLISVHGLPLHQVPTRAPECEFIPSNETEEDEGFVVLTCREEVGNDGSITIICGG